MSLTARKHDHQQQASNELIGGRLPWPHAGRVQAGLSLLAWVGIIVAISSAFANAADGNQPEQDRTSVLEPAAPKLTKYPGYEA